MPNALILEAPIWLIARYVPIQIFHILVKQKITSQIHVNAGQFWLGHS